MKRYESLIIAALVLLFFLMCLPVPGFAVPHRMRAGRRQRQRMQRASEPQCNQNTGTFYLKNMCKNGFVTVVKNRPLVQTEGLDENHSDAALLRESCFMRGASGWDERLQPLDQSVGPFFRYQHKASKKYICFNKQGKLRTMNLPKAQRKGRLCMFTEEPVGPKDLHLRSAHNSKWYLGFNPKRLTHVHGGDFEASLPRIGGKGYGPRRCDFKFEVGKHSPANYNWKGIFDQYKSNSTKNNVNTKAALEHSEILDKSLNSEKEILLKDQPSNDLNTIETDPVIVISKKSDKPAVSAAENNKISTSSSSSVYSEKLQMHKFLLRAKKHKRIRHFKHKRPRLQKQRQRRPRLQVKNQRQKNSSSSIGQKMMKRRGQSVPKRDPRPTRRRPRV